MPIGPPTVAERRRPRRSDIRLSARTLLLSILLCGLVAGALLVRAYDANVAAPVRQLRGAVSYTPLHSSTQRVTGLGSPSRVALSDVSTYLVIAVLASEDRHMAGHRGVDLGEIGWSLWDALRDRPLRGASTIHQQLAKNVFLSSDRSLRRKLVEALYAIEMDRSLSKPEILSLYLDVVQFGSGVHGVPEAAAAYFDSAPAQLSVEQSALLAFFLPAPRDRGERFSLGQLESRDTKRIAHVLLRLHAVLHHLGWQPGDPPPAFDAVLSAPLGRLVDDALATPAPEVEARVEASMERVTASPKAGSNERTDPHTL